MFRNLIDQIQKNFPMVSVLDGFLSRNVKLLASAVITVFTFFTILGYFQVLNIKPQYNLRQFFPNHHPLLAQDDIVKEKFAINGVSPFLIVANIPQENELDWSYKPYIEATKVLSEKIKAMAHIKEVKSFATLQGAVQNGGGLGIGSIVDYLTPTLLKKEIKRNPILSPLFLSRDVKMMTIFVVTEDLNIGSVEKIKNQLIVLAKEQLSFANVNIGGVPAIQSDVNEILSHEIVHFVGIAVIMSIIALMFIFKNYAPIFVCTLAAFVTNIISIWGISIFGFSFNILSSTIPILITMTVISISIHSVLRLIERAELNSDIHYDKIIIMTFKELFRPNLLTALTTSVGFFTLTLSDAPIIKEFGLSVGIALLVTWFVSTTLLPSLLVIANPPILRGWMKAKARWPFFILRFHKTILFSIIALSILGAWKGQFLSWKARLFDDLPENHSVRRTTEIVDQSLGGLVPLDVEIHLPSGDNPWGKEGKIEELDELAKSIREKKGVGSILTLADILRASGLQNGKQKATPAEIMFLLSMSSENPLRQYVSNDGLSTRLAIRLKDIAGSRMWNLVQEIRQEAKDQFPKSKIRISGTAAYVHDINNALSKDLLYGFWQAMLVIFILLVFSYRSVAWAFLACLPNLTPPSILLGALALWEIPIKPGIAIILSISLGLAFNNTVYLLERMRGLLQKGHSFQKSLFHTFWSEANPCFFSSMILVIGFASFAVSYFKMNQLFGVFMVLSVLAGLLGDLIMLPALLQFILERGTLFFKGSAKQVSILVFVISFFHPKTSEAAVVAATKQTFGLTQLGQLMKSRVATKDESGVIEMKIVETDGSSKTRQISYQRLTDKNNHFTLMRMLTPKDIKGTALLSVIKNEEEEKWIYLPNSKQTRKISTSESSSARVLDSELYSEDFDLGNLKGANSKISRREADGTFVVETSLSAAKGSYSKSIAWVGKDGELKKAQVFDKKGQLLKQIDFLNYQMVGSGKFRAGQINIINLQNKRKTELAFSEMKINQNLKASDFSTRALAEGF